MLLKRAYSKSELEHMIAQTQFRTALIDQNLLGFEITLCKTRSAALADPLLA